MCLTLLLRLETSRSQNSRRSNKNISKTLLPRGSTRQNPVLISMSASPEHLLRPSTQSTFMPVSAALDSKIVQETARMDILGPATTPHQPAPEVRFDDKIANMKTPARAEGQTNNSNDQTDKIMGTIRISVSSFKQHIQCQATPKITWWSSTKLSTMPPNNCSPSFASNSKLRLKMHLRRIS